MKKIFAALFAVYTVILFAGLPTCSVEASKPFTWRGVEVTEFPYVVKEYPKYPKGMSIKIDGKDILAGEKVQGVSYKGETLILDNADIKGVIRVNGIAMLNVSLIGDNIIDRMIFGGTSLNIIGDGTLTAKLLSTDKQRYVDTSITVSENVRIIGKTDYENDTELNSPLKFGSVIIEDNGYLKCADIQTYKLTLHDNAYVSASHCSYIDDLLLNDNSVMEVVTDYEKYSRLETDYTMGRCLYGVPYIYIRNDARLSVVCDTSAYGTLDHNAKINVSDNGIFDISGSSKYGISLDKSTYGTLVMNDNSKVSISGFDIGLMAQRVDINGGTLDIHSNICALQIDDIISPTAKFEATLSINGDLVSRSCDWKLTDYTHEENKQYGWYYDILRSADTGEPLKDFSITVAPKKDKDG